MYLTICTPVFCRCFLFSHPVNVFIPLFVSVFHGLVSRIFSFRVFVSSYLWYVATFFIFITHCSLFLQQELSLQIYVRYYTFSHGFLCVLFSWLGYELLYCLSVLSASGRDIQYLRKHHVFMLFVLSLISGAVTRPWAIQKSLQVVGT